jgi:hypothetical protein
MIQIVDRHSVAVHQNDPVVVSHSGAKVSNLFVSSLIVLQNKLDRLAAVMFCAKYLISTVAY